MLFFPIIITREGRFFNRFWAGAGGSPLEEGGVFFLLLEEEGERLRPTFLFLSREKKKRADFLRAEVPRFARLRSETRLRAQARYKEKERWEWLS